MDVHRSISPGLEGVRNDLVNVAMKIVNNYNIDGLHLCFNSGRSYRPKTNVVIEVTSNATKGI